MPETMLRALLKATVSLLTIGLVKAFWPGLLPLPFLAGWEVQGNFFDWCRSAWILLVWGTGLTIFFKFGNNNPRRYNRHAELHFLKCSLISLWAGVAEEVNYRSLHFLSAIVWVQIANVIFFGLVGFLHVHLFGPIANFVSFGSLQDMLFHPLGWSIGAGLLASNASFRDGHAYQGPFGIVNSWFIGMFMFWMVFTYGLLAAIVIHALYDFLIFFVKYIDAVIERRNGHA